MADFIGSCKGPIGRTFAAALVTILFTEPSYFKINISTSDGDYVNMCPLNRIRHVKFIADIGSVITISAMKEIGRKRVD